MNRLMKYFIIFLITLVLTGASLRSCEASREDVVSNTAYPIGDEENVSQEGCQSLATAQKKYGNVFYNNMYDLSIRKWNSIYNPNVPHSLIKAQLIAESGLHPKAVSPVGAAGLGQFMPNTWKDMQRNIGVVDVYNTSQNIQATAYYMSSLRGQFKKPRPEWDRHSLALASYNAGLGNILKAQALANGNQLLYVPMSLQLHRVTGHHHKETLTYVNRIWEYNTIITSIQCEELRL